MRIGIAVKPGLTAARGTLVELEAWLRARGAEAVWSTEAAKLFESGTRPAVDRMALPQQSDLVLVLGGDGTLLAMAKAIAESGRDIPFVVENRAAADGTLRGTRWFGFPRVTRVMRDTMHVDGGEIVQRLGRRGGLEVRLAARASAEGMLLRSRRLAWRIRGLRVPLPRIAGVEVRETEPCSAMPI